MVNKIQEIVESERMPIKKHILVCRSGAKLVMSEDGSWAYMGGDAYAIGVDDNTRFDELKVEMADMWKLDRSSITVKYLLPNTSNNLVTISSDRDIRSMREFCEDSATVDVYVSGTSSVTSDALATHQGSMMLRGFLKGCPLWLQQLTTVV
ncbi:uncharacterized protein LOC141690102 isoform X2 [Apium graveolens]|uniref:uncharacterized protein LOC141690102 isoform X2 n=1 Tax=Apium graveolens TaxID=4045 RepID=UPI003D794E0A